MAALEFSLVFQGQECSMSSVSHVASATIERFMGEFDYSEKDISGGISGIFAEARN
jgi:hypothetical protein